MFKFGQDSYDIDALINRLLGNTSISGSSSSGPVEPPSAAQYYQLPVRHTKGGAPIDEDNKPWVVGHFFPGKFLNKTHPHGHNGVDLKAPRNSPVYSIGPGTVIDTPVYPRTGGNTIRISHEDGKVKSYYAHLDSVNVKAGDKVELSTIIGRLGDTGNAKGRGAHLHYEVSVDGAKVDPKGLTGKLVGSLSKKAEFINNLVQELNKMSTTKEDRFRILRKIAVELNEDFVISDLETKVFDLLKEVIANKAPDTTLRVAGGWVRDKLLGKESHDIDIAVDNMSGLAFAKLARDYMASQGMKVPKSVSVVEANPEAKKSLETAILPVFGIPIDFVQLRADVYGSESRRPDTVVGVPPEEDAKRRDLTINSIFYNVNTGQIEDFVGGVEDLKRGVARTPLDPYNTFMEDPLRILRAVRFGAKYNLNIDPALIEAARHPDVQGAFRDKISKERIWSELVGQAEGDGWKRGLMVGPNFDRAAELLGELGLREALLVPSKEQIARAISKRQKAGEKLKWDQGFGDWEMDQNNPYHDLSVWRHTLKALNFMKKVHEANVSESKERDIRDQIVRNLAMLFHDIGKCDACSQQTHPEKGHSTYHEHELSSAVIAEEILKDLKAPNDIRERVVSLIKNHMRLHHLPAGSRGAGLRRVLRDVGADNWPLLVEMSQSDSIGKTKDELDPKYQAFADRIDEFLAKTEGQSEAKPPLNGKEIMAILGLKKGGPAVGRAVKALKELMLENPDLSKEEAEAFLRSTL
jgi:tRNA nucleotidyltransferase/poly(A) polymerase